MKISAFCSVTKPEERQDIWRESITSVVPWADEIIIVCGHESDTALIAEWWNGFISQKEENPLFKLVELEWPEEWSWDELPKHLNYGLEHCSGDWVIRFDIDYVFDDKPNAKNSTNTTFGKELRMMLSYGNHQKVATFQKLSATTVDKFYEKGGVQLAINKGRFPNVVFGRDKDKYSDLCVPILWDGKTVDEKDVPLGSLLAGSEIGRTRQYFYNYDYTFKTREFTIKEFARFARAHRRYFGSTKWGQNEKESIEKFMEMMKARWEDRAVYTFKVKGHPKFIQDKVKNITKEQFGFNGWGHLVESKDE